MEGIALVVTKSECDDLESRSKRTTKRVGNREAPQSAQESMIYLKSTAGMDGERLASVFFSINQSGSD